MPNNLITLFQKLNQYVRCRELFQRAGDQEKHQQAIGDWNGLAADYSSFEARTLAIQACDFIVRSAERGEPIPGNPDLVAMPNPFEVDERVMIVNNAATALSEIARNLPISTWHSLHDAQARNRWEQEGHLLANASIALRDLQTLLGLVCSPPSAAVIAESTPAMAESYAGNKSEANKSPARMTVEDANKKAMDLAQSMKRRFFELSIREQARLIGCAFQTWKETLFFKEADKKRPQKQKGGNGARRASSLTGNMEATLHDGKREEELQRLIDEQQDDEEPSPVDSTPRKVYSPKRL